MRCVICHTQRAQARQQALKFRNPTDTLNAAVPIVLPIMKILLSMVCFVAAGSGPAVIFFGSAKDLSL